MIASIRLQNFRNYRHLDAALAPGFNVLHGPNAQGKTNFLESIYLLSTSRLLRGQRDSECVLDGEDYARVEATLAPTDTTISMEVPRSGRKRAALNGLNLPRASDLIGRLTAVCISAEDLETVRGDPSERRLFFDLELSSRSDGYLHRLALYKRALEQRNALLRDSRERHYPSETFEVWEDQLAQSGSELRSARRTFLGELIPYSAQIHEQLGQGEALSLNYLQKDDANEYTEMLSALAQSRSADIARGGTSVGPHRDDFDVLIDGRAARLFGSQGQQRSAIIALKLGCLKLAAEREGTPPCLLLDDILSDLDERRRRNLIDIVLSEAGQAVLTCTEPAAAGSEILSRAKLFAVSHGEVEEE